jgi:hypothetical protein
MFAAIAKHIEPITRRFSPLLELFRPSGRGKRPEPPAWQAISEEHAPEAPPAQDPAVELLAVLDAYAVQFERLTSAGTIIVQLKDDVRTIDFSGADEELARAVNEARLVQAFVRQAGIDATASPEEAAQALAGIPLDFYTQTLRESVEVLQRK